MFSYFCPLHYTKFNLLIVMHIYHRTIFTLPYFISCLHYAAYIIASYTHNSAFLLSVLIFLQFYFYYYWPNNSRSLTLSKARFMHNASMLGSHYYYIYIYKHAGSYIQLKLMHFHQFNFAISPSIILLVRSLCQ